MVIKDTPSDEIIHFWGKFGVLVLLGTSIWDGFREGLWLEHDWMNTRKYIKPSNNFRNISG